MPTALPAHPLPGSRQRVLIALYWWEDRVFEGVAKVAAEHGWVLDCRMRWTHSAQAFAQWRGDGIIANPGASRRLVPLVDLLERATVPIVGLQTFGDYRSTARVLVDHREIGRLAAEHFLALGFRQLAFVRFADNPIERARSEGYRETAQAAGAAFCEIPFAQLRERLAELPLPVALWALNDVNALEVTTACLEAGYRIPEQVAILGADDTRIVCDLAEVPLSSIDCNHERQGYEAAQLLQRLMAGEGGAGEPILIPPTGVTSRKSTDTIAVPDLPTTQALRLIRDRFREPLRVEEIAQQVGVSSRRLQASFRAHLGFTMVHELARVRVEHACTLLADPELKLDAVAYESGFSSRFHFIRAFQRITGETPSALRKSLLAHP
ncbi:MAG: substrate-binding domain-containing protein [Verrucomicrobiota bacterium JB022]|nr:substrate-binding domain-containing protein [Verrucomicrobiota bacterium JB022]